MLIEGAFLSYNKILIVLDAITSPHALPQAVLFLPLGGSANSRLRTQLS
jgi:hypothetical protein